MSFGPFRMGGEYLVAEKANNIRGASRRARAPPNCGIRPVCVTKLAGGFESGRPASESRLGWPMGVSFAKLPGPAQAALLPASTAQPSDIPQWKGGLGKPMGIELANPS